MAEQTTEDAPSEEIGAKRRHPHSLANLRPPWAPGRSGNPSGLTKDGKSPKGQKLEASLLDELERSGGMPALAKAWVRQAKRGNSTALAEILKRLYPVPDDDAGKGRVVLEGLRLELTPQGAAVTLARTSSAPAEASVVVESESESRTGGSESASFASTPLLGPENGGGSNGVVLA